MSKKAKKIGIIFLLVLVTILCVALGFKTRYDNRIKIIQFEPQGPRQSMGYMLKTNKDKLIMIDGGTKLDKQHVSQKIKENGEEVEYWFITHAHDDHYGALNEILKENDDIKINNIIVSLNDEEWYKINDENRFEDIKEFLSILKREDIAPKVREAILREKISVDNLNFKILKLKSPEIVENAGNNQSMIIKVDNMFKSALFLGDLGVQGEEDFVNNNLDEIKVDAVQMAHHGQQGVGKETYEKINPKICMWPTPDWLWDNNNGNGFNTAEYKTIETRQWIIEEMKIKQNYIAKDGDLTIEIW